MLRTAFIGNCNNYDKRICEWLSEHTDLCLIIWTNHLGWATSRRPGRYSRGLRRAVDRSKKLGAVRATDEALYYLAYRTFIARKESQKINTALKNLECLPKKSIDSIEQVFAQSIKSDELIQKIRSYDLDAAFAMCVDVYFPKKLIESFQHGCFLWHEGITPEYRGVYSPFWALVKKDYQNLGYTLLRMNSRLDAGEIYVNGAASDVDPLKDWHSYIGHKAVLDSLPRVQMFLKKLEAGELVPIKRPDAVDGYYSYPTFSGLLKIAAHRARHKLASSLFGLNLPMSGRSSSKPPLGDKS